MSSLLTSHVEPDTTNRKDEQKVNGLMYKTDDFNTGKCRFKPIQSDLKSQTEG